MHHLTLAAIAALAATSAAQEFLHYKFDSNCTTEVVNYATGPSAFAQNGTFETNTTTPFAPGVFGGALAGGVDSTNQYNRVRTNWTPQAQPLTGDMTFAFFAKERTSPGTALNYLCGVTTSANRLFTNGVAQRGLYFRNIVASGPQGVDLSALTAVLDFQTLAAANWVHIAIVVDQAATTATWYANGTQVHQVTGVGGALINSAGIFMVGSQLSTLESNYDLDEFLISNRAFTAAEVLALSLSPFAGDGDYTSAIPSQCGAGNVTLSSSGGRPFDGNLLYTLNVAPTTTSLFVLLAGFDRCSFGGTIPLPLDGTPLAPLLAGCWIVADAPVTLAGVAGPAPSPIALPLPSGTPPALGIFTQVLALDAATFATSMSNGFATSVGH
jgi:hypothetical protein